MDLFAFTRTAFNGAFDVIFGHIASLSLLDGKTQCRVKLWIGTTLRRNDQLADDFRPQLRTRRIGFTFFVFNRAPFIMT